MSGSPWFNEQERRKAVLALISASSYFIGPLAPLIAWGVEYGLDHKDQIFDALGRPVQAFASDRSRVTLSDLSTSLPQAQAELSITTRLTPSARSLGLDSGDPVTLIVSGHSYRQARSGLVVPTRIGEQVSLSVPLGSYAVTALGSRQVDLFSVGNPYTSVSGTNLLVVGNERLGMGLVRPRMSIGRTLEQRYADLTTFHCLWCVKSLASGNMLAHILSCPSRPRFERTRTSIAALQSYLDWSNLPITHQCRDCSQWFRSQLALDAHRRWERLRREIKNFLP